MSSRISSIGSIRRYSNIGYRISVLSDLVATNRHLEIRDEHIVVRLGSLINAICRRSGLRVACLALSRYVNSQRSCLSRLCHVSTLSNRCQIIIQSKFRLSLIPLSLLDSEVPCKYRSVIRVTEYKSAVTAIPQNRNQMLRHRGASDVIVNEVIAINRDQSVTT